MIFQHVLREENVVANVLANLVFYFVGTLTFNSFYELPSAGRRLINMDKAQTPNLRVRVVKIDVVCLWFILSLYICSYIVNIFSNGINMVSYSIWRWNGNIMDPTRQAGF